MLPVLPRYMTPLCTSGIGWFAPTSFIDQLHASFSSFTFCARDLVERAVAPRLVVAARHQPVARRRVLQHRVGDRHVVLHFAVHRMPARRRGAGGTRRGAIAIAGAGGGPRHGALPGRDRADRVTARRLQRLAAGRRAVRTQNERGDVQVFPLPQARLPRRHRRRHVIDEVARRALAPGGHEIRPAAAALRSARPDPAGGNSRSWLDSWPVRPSPAPR